ncbi:hypothetical protein IBE33_09355 [Francisella philomiragia]|uniref:hypothetical protein n=1 Tax=Francisella philomiragia TaxID=28110 RepID=UPI001907D328|nr:hypothetical protein [Francisella philomiragia]MBK2341716.1 hypothetical protein [Francisella philomiragia]
MSDNKQNEVVDNLKQGLEITKECINKNKETKKIMLISVITIIIAVFFGGLFGIFIISCLIGYVLFTLGMNKKNHKDLLNENKEENS